MRVLSLPGCLRPEMGWGGTGAVGKSLTSTTNSKEAEETTYICIEV